MRNLTLLGSCLLIFGGNAVAADLAPVSSFAEPPAFAAAPRWTGPYLGLNAGAAYARARSGFSLNQGPAFGVATTRPTGPLGGIQAGYSWQSGAFVFGAEADLQFAGAKDSKSAACAPATCGVALAARYQQEMPWFGTVRARAGYASGDWLVYATGGYAFARLETVASAAAPVAAARAQWDDTSHGWALGAGVEFALSRSWSAKAEFLHLGFSQHDRSWTIAANASVRDKTELSANIVRAGVNYGF